MPKNSTSIKLPAVLGSTAIIFVLDWFYLAYMTSKGFEPKIHEFMLSTFKLAVPLQWLPVAGVILVSFVVWYEVSFTIFPRRTAMEEDTLSNIRLMRAIVLALAVFTCLLYIPYIVGSDWFWARLSGASSVPQIRDLGLSLLNTDQTLMALDQIWQYSISQSVALMGMVMAAWGFGRGPKRIRR